MISIQEIGIAMSVRPGWQRLQRLKESLGQVSDAGYRLVEIELSPYGMIVNGQIRQQELAAFQAVLGNFDLQYTIHGYNRLNLAYDPRHELCRQIMQCQLQICGAVGACRLVYHSGLQALDSVRHGVRRKLLSDDELVEGAQREVLALKELGEIAASQGVLIGVENGDSHLWEHEVIARMGLPREALSKHHARLHIEPIVQQLEKIDHANVAMTLDIAHLHIAAHDMDFDYLEAVATAAPWVRHLHANDNFGRLDWGFDQETERWPYGEADIHMPPGWGSIPYADVFARLPDYDGYLILEIKEGFADYIGESLLTMRGLLAGQNAG